MKVMNLIGNKYEITMFQWYEVLAKAEKRLQESIKCNELYGDNKEWISEDTEKVEKIKNDIEEVKAKIENLGIFIDYKKIQGLVQI